MQERRFCFYFFQDSYREESISSCAQTRRLNQSKRDLCKSGPTLCSKSAYLRAKDRSIIQAG